jgi:kynurenine formamidase
MRVVDLTQPYGPSTIVWPGSHPPEFTTVENHAEHGCFARAVHLYEHTGTHLDAPAHFVDGAETVDQISAERLVCPLAVIDIGAPCAKNPDYALTIADIERSEAAHGAIPAGSAVLVHTGWGQRYRDAGRYITMDGEGRLRFPGVGREAALWLIDKRRITGIGIDTMGIDPGADRDFTVHRHATLPNGVWHLEGLVNLEKLPARGATVFVGVLPFVGGSGAPARVIALI